MRLYHGTSEPSARRILNEGILPRAHTGNTNWKHTVESNANMVYLSAAYAGYFAMQAAGEDEKIAIVEVDTDRLSEKQMMPDEDVLAQGLYHAARNGTIFPKTKKSWTLIEFTDFVNSNIDKWQHRWVDSLSAMGTCSHKGSVPASAITRISIVDIRKTLYIATALADPTITPLNYQFKGKYYAMLTRWLMREDVTLKDYNEAAYGGITFPEDAGQNTFIENGLRDQQSIQIMNL